MKTCWLMTVKYGKDTGDVRCAIKRAINVAGYRKKVSCIWHDKEVEIVLHKSTIWDAMRLDGAIKYLTKSEIEVQEM